MPIYPTRRYKSKKWGRLVGSIFLIAALAGLVYLLLQFDIRGNRPTANIIENRSKTPLDLTQSLHLGKSLQWSLVTENTKGGICGIDFTLDQNGRTLSLVQKKFPRNQNQKQVISVAASDLAKLQEGELSGSIKIKSCALWPQKLNLDFKGLIDLSPPRVSLLSSQHYINQGGADVAVYSVGSDAVWSGIRIGNYEFKGYPKPGSQNGEHFAFFVYSYEFGAGQPIDLVAYDQAGNMATASLAPAKFFPKEFRKRDLPIDDNFISTKVADIISNTEGLKNTGNNLENYLLVNRDLRKKNAATLVEISKKSEPFFYWKDAFKPLTAAVEANFADYRSYIYNGQKVDEQVHLGFDLANFERNPIEAANRGKVIFSGYFGIYGNTVLIDHGYGLISLYGHLSSMDVFVGDFVEKNQKIGNSGVTGLAGGDHLHFSLLIQGVQTNPVEFWDQHWIDDHVYLRLGKENFGKTNNSPTQATTPTNQSVQ